MSLTVGFCADAGPAVGLGHLRRCLTLAAALRARGARVRFGVPTSAVAVDLLRKMAIDDIDELEGGPAAALTTLARSRVDVIVVDAYGITSEQLAAVHGPVIAVIDDVADRVLPVALVVNVTIGASPASYKVDKATRLLLGPQCALLRAEFADDVVREIRPRVERMLVTVGGSDATGLTSSLIAWSRQALPSAAIDVVIGPFVAPSLARLIDDAADRVRVHHDPSDMRGLMLGCDLALSGGGQTTYELAATGTPTVAVAVADNQAANLRGLSASGALVWAGAADEAGLADRVARELRDLAADARRRAAMSRAGRQLVDGRGAARVADAIVEVCHR